MTHYFEIKPDMPVICSQGEQFATIDHIENSNYIKLKKDDSGKHHYIPISWVVSTANGEVIIDRPGEEAMKEWNH